MTQAEINKNTVANVMAMEDAKATFEAIGDINNDYSAMQEDNTPVEYNPDDLMAVTVTDTDPMGTIPDLSGAGAEMDEETQKFVVDQFAEKVAQLPGETIDLADITPIATVIKAENGIKQDVNSFLEKMVMDAKNRLSTQNVSEAQPNGTAIDFNNDSTDGGDANIDALGGMDTMPGMDGMGGIDGMGDGVTGLEEAPGGIDAGMDPSLETNPDDGMGMDAGMGAGMDMGGDGSDMDMGGDMAGDLGGDASGFGGDDAGLGGDDLGVGGDDAGFDSGAIDDALGDTSADGMDMGGEVGGDDMGGSDVGITDDASSLGDMGDDESTDPGMAGADMGEDVTDDTGDDMSDSDFEAAMTAKKAQLESIRSKYIQDRAATKIRNIVESYQDRVNRVAKKAKLEAIVANYKKSEAEKAAKDKAQLEAIANDYARKVRAEREEHALKAKLESISTKYKRDELRRAISAKVKKAAFESEQRSNASLNARLESISANYHQSLRQNAATQARLESIAKKYKNSDEYKALTESKSTPAEVTHREPTLKDRLDAIVAKVK